MAVIWNITKVEYNTDSDKGIVNARWAATDSEVVGSGDSEKTHLGRVLGMESYTPDSSAEGYIDYDSLTESDIITWVKTTLGAEGVTRVEGEVAAKIVKSKTPPTAWGLPF
jgi:hypothetical protein